MKNTFTIHLLVLLFCYYFHLWGVFGVDEDEETLVSVMEGDSVTLTSDVTDINSYYLTLWRFGDDGFTIAQINRDKIIYSDVLNLNGRMSVNDQTGSLTITNTRTKHSGLYKMEISKSTETSIKKFRLTVYESQPVDKAEKGELKMVTVMEGFSADMIMEDEIERKDLIVWRFGDDGILIVKGDREDNRITYHLEEIYGDRLKLNSQTGSLTITDTRSTDTGLYKVKISSNKRGEYMRFILTVSGPGVSSGGIAGIVIVVMLLVISAAVGVFLFFYRRRKQNDVVVDKIQSIKPGDSVILDTGIKEIKKEDEITWKFEGTTIAELKGDQTFVYVDERFKDKLKLNPQNGALTIKDTNTDHAGLYKVKMQTENLTGSLIIKVSASDKLQVKEGDSFTLSSGHTEIGDNGFTWRFESEVITEFSGSQPSVSVKESFIDQVLVDSQTGSLQIKSSKIKDAGLYQLQISGSKDTKKFIVAVTGRAPMKKRLEQKDEKLSVNEEDSFTLSSGHSEIGDNVFTWMLSGTLVAKISRSLESPFVSVEFKDKVQVDPITGSLTVKKGRTKDSGLYQLQISESDGTKKLEKNFIVTVHDTVKQVSVKEGDALTLPATLTQMPAEIKWEFENICIAEFTGIGPADVNKDERFKDRLRLDHETANLTIINIRKSDIGLYTLKTDPERKFCVTVKGRPWPIFPEHGKERLDMLAVIEGESLPLSTKGAFTKWPDMIKWEFKNKSIAVFTDTQHAEISYNKTFEDRLDLDHETGSLIIKHARKTDSGTYSLITRTGDSENKFFIGVCVLPVNIRRVAQPTSMIEYPSDRCDSNHPLLGTNR